MVQALLVSSAPVNESVHSDMPVSSEQLWVDKYAPNSFTELLSDEQTNREVVLLTLFIYLFLTDFFLTCFGSGLYTVFIFISKEKLDPLCLQVLLWLKQWDSSVFGSQIRATTDDVLFSLRRHSSLAQHQKFVDGKSSFRKNRWTSLGNQFFKQSNGFSQGDGSLKAISEICNKKSLGNNPPEQKVGHEVSLDTLFFPFS